MATPSTALVEPGAGTPAPPPTQKTDSELLEQFIKTLDPMKADIELLKKAQAEGKAPPSEVLERLEKHEKQIAAIATRTSRPPGGGPVEPEHLSLGQSFTQSEAFKNHNWSGKFKLQYSHRGRLEMRAATPITEGGSGLYIFPRRVAWVGPPMFPLVMRDVLDVIPLTGTNAVEYVTETWTDATDYQVTEGTRKAQGGVTYAHVTSMVRTIAQFVKVSTQMLADVPEVQTSIDQRLIYYVLKKESQEILYGDNSAGHLNGIMTQATAYVVPPAISASVTTALDTILAAIVQVANNGYVPTAIVLNPTDWAGLQLQKTTQGAYILQGPGFGPPTERAQPTLWGLPVVLSYNMKAGTGTAGGDFLVGSFPGNAALFDREQAIVEISYENEDDFVNNLATIRCEERVALAVYVPAAFVKGVFPTGVLTAATNHPPREAEHERAKK